jgi:hypothetical protein
MADAKISALTAATTPVAGTEVLPIVQSGTTKKVSIANLTAGRDVGTKNLIATGQGVFQGPLDNICLPRAYKFPAFTGSIKDFACR